jgi:thymidylate kinase
MTGSIAIIGPDGAGKTTITEHLVRSQPDCFKYVYMGVNLDACNHVLPTTRWVRRVKRWMDRQPGKPSTGEDGRPFRNASQRLRRGRLWAAARLINTLADEWYRQLVSWYYQWQGRVVVYDRHFVFDFWDEPSSGRRPTLGRRIHRWCLQSLYPRPDLVIFLDAPPEVLLARKKEWSLADLQRKRQTLMRAGKTMSNFHRIDATQSLEAVYAQVTRKIGEFFAAHPAFAGGSVSSLDSLDR